MPKTPLQTSDPELYSLLVSEVSREETTLELIASENLSVTPFLKWQGE